MGFFFYPKESTESGAAGESEGLELMECVASECDPVRQPGLVFVLANRVVHPTAMLCARSSGEFRATAF